MKPRHFFLLAMGVLFAGCRADTAIEERSADRPTPATVAVASNAVPTDHVLVEPSTIDWQAGPPSLEPGAEAAVIEGDPSQPGFFNLRLRLPDGFRIAPHFHPQPERVTVISGTFLLGEGSAMDPADVRALEPGSYFAMPPGMQHYAIARGETVIQLTSTGPWDIEYVDPGDDPRLR